MNATRETILVTGVSGNLGLRLLPLLSDYDIVGVDMRPPENVSLARFESLDLGNESSAEELVRILRETGATMVVHLAFVIDPQRTGVLDVDRMWRINVAGTARVMEAIGWINREGGKIRKFLYPSSVAVYGPETDGPVNEDHPLGAHTLTYAIHKKEVDEVVRYRADMMGDCSIYMLRPHIFTGATVQNYLVGALRGTPLGNGSWGDKLRRRGTRLPMILPFGKAYLQKTFQFVHVDDVARLLAYIVHRPDHSKELVILNVAARGESITYSRCAEIANARIIRLPGRWACRKVLERMWDWGISSVPPDALPYIIGSYTMDTSRLRRFLGDNYPRVIRYTVEEALADSFRDPNATPTTDAAATPQESA